MSDQINLSSKIKNHDSVCETDSIDDLLNKSNSNKNVAQILLKESTNYLNDSQSKGEQAREYINVSNDLKKKAAAVRAKADELRQRELSEEEKANAAKAIINMLPNDLKMLIPANASPEVLDKIADELEARAKGFRIQADNLLQSSEESDKLAKQLKEQAGLISKKDLKISDLHLKSASAHSQGLLMVLKKLGIAKLDAEYKEQVAYSQKAQQG